ncbi:M14 family metallopeptidase [Shewanella pneumatophori]|uniref:M14 family metallocarboxypeptidase n=1 Tax=Shewanella pneumatophori TaxID=314092 RepID=A0A9X2CE01_9GAMM|nr:M14 family metallocarboxypeptidase [Shewanella pneumatophori]MCL1139803.1 M14 family metallocarboxypeptidase [Shewanella pneumatophori]
MDQQVYAIGVKGQKWGDAEKAQWLNVQSVKRSYQDEVLTKVNALKARFDVEQYGALSYDAERYPLFAVKSKNWDLTKPTILVTGGVHGYETSGVQGAIRFIETKAEQYAEQFNILVTPCISPWGYETINRWNPKAIDPNRSFYADSPAEESAALIKLLADLGVEIFAHIDLHETTDTDNSEFRPALAARDAVEHTNWNIPDGFYLVGDTINPQDAFQTAMIKSVEQVTHIAPADEDGKLIGVELSQFGVINYATKALGLCAGVTDAKYVTTTEVYPDSPLSDDENCILAQVAAITGGLDYLLSL